MNPVSGLRTWVEIYRKALEHNLKVFLNLIPKQTKFMAVIKSNAYGHGLVQVAKLLANNQLPIIDNQCLWFGVDSIVEGLRLRREEIKNPILVLGSTLPSRIKEAADQNIILTVSNFESLMSLIRANRRPVFHLKVDTGMNRQGFLLSVLPRVVKLLQRSGLSPAGIYTHLAAKDRGYPVYTNLQLSNFKKTLKLFKRAGFKNLIRHAAASDATLLFPEAHLDMVRVGMGLYGYWPSWVAKVKHPVRMVLKPVLSWKTVVSEVKMIPKGSYVGYDLTEQVSRNTKIAILPIGYWHGYDRGLSSVGKVLIRGRRAKVLGRVSMDMTVVNVTGIPKIKVGDTAVLIGKQNGGEIRADESALKIGTSEYEFLTRINPLIKRFVR